MNWIKVSDRLPDKDKEVLAWDGEHQFVASRWWAQDRPQDVYFKSIICTCCSGICNGSITHWCDLPGNPND